ncbi:MAG TPA: hypothetical protein VGH91_12495 [Gammaproteobacteria bacterium]|jgi:hypothetical protein
MTKRRLICLFAALCLLPMSAWADKDGPSWVPEFGMEEGLTFGGGQLLDPRVTGQPSLTPSDMNLYAGDTFYIQGYYRQAIGHTGLSLKVSGGFAGGCSIPTCLDQLGDYFANSDGPYQFTTVTGDVALEYAWENGRIGVGRTARYLNAVTSSSSVYAFQEVDLRPAYGWFVEYEWDKLGLRYTHLIYHSNSGYAVNGSNVGVYLHFNYHDEDWYPGGRYFEEGAGVARQTVALAFNPREWSF